MGRLVERKPLTKLTATVLLLLATVTGTVRSQTPPTQINCMSAFVSLLPCVGYVMGTNHTAPSACCSGFVAVIVNNAGPCLCQFLGVANPLGVPVKQKQALELPAACNVNISSLATQCTAIGVPLNPASPAPSTSVAATPTPHTPPLTIPGPSFVPPTASIVPTLNVPSPVSWSPNLAPTSTSGDSTLGPAAPISSDGIRNFSPPSTINNLPSTDASAVTSANGASVVLTRWTSSRLSLGIILASTFII
ncbi:hypothetical protein SUGI_0072500 [Cryptomeria japonica]|uniref:non-specific lipid transfer protein GPI-anchored 5 n=1 Tax=Cryptomeria japonica TaxID=3369 RepID=UPI002408D28E|nr:non-specific lipid transfer protein GPI-anchored 5 [Cryptomeria japonica]GLJ07687.1 hypothetical protein SUGI_0072500 [Cryptomeria japonica]